MRPVRRAVRCVNGCLSRSFLEEAAKRNKQQKKREYTAVDMEAESLLEHDALNRDYGMGEQREAAEIVPTRIPRIPMKYTSSATLHVGKM